MNSWPAALSLMALALSACSSLPDVSQPPPADVTQRPAEQATRRPSSTDYRFSGRLLLKQAERQDIVGLDWQHQADHDALLFTNPLGQGLAELSRNAQGARLQLADQRIFQAADWQQLARELFAVELPLDTLPAWLLGQAQASAAVDVQRDALGRITRLITTDWQVDYLGYASQEADALPILLEVQHRQQTPEAFKLRLKIDHWQF